MVSEFRNKVLTVVKRIPRGETLSYSEVAKSAGKPKAARVVGNILNGNHDPTIPCHRVIRADGTPGGYNRGTVVKISILKKEGAIQ